jgi:periplasmic copper chaperone A
MALTRLLILLAFAAAPAAAQQGPIVIELAIVGTATEVGEHVGGYVRIRNAGGEADRLVAAKCTCSRLTEIHSTRSGEMVTLAGLEIPAGGELEIRPGSGLHLMLEAVGPIPAGSEVEMVLRFERAGEFRRRFAVVGDPQSAWPALDPPPPARR